MQRTSPLQVPHAHLRMQTTLCILQILLEFLREGMFCTLLYTKAPIRRAPGKARSGLAYSIESYTTVIVCCSPNLKPEAPGLSPRFTFAQLNTSLPCAEIT